LILALTFLLALGTLLAYRCRAPPAAGAGAPAETLLDPPRPPFLCRGLALIIYWLAELPLNGGQGRLSQRLSRGNKGERHTSSRGLSISIVNELFIDTVEGDRYV
jgi:hypothetical protein